MSENLFKILVVGASGVGKTKLLTNFAELIYKESSREDTIIDNVGYIFRKKKKYWNFGTRFSFKRF